MTLKTLGNFGLEEYDRRQISVETADRFGVFTGRFDGETQKVVPDSAGNILVFPYIEHEREVGEKYRAPGKRFWQREGSRKTFYNADCMDDPALEDGRLSLVVTEGEFDAQTAAEGGFLAVSCPDGAPAVPKGRAFDDLDPLQPEQEREGKFEYLWNNRDRLKKIKRFIIATDDDGPGKRLGLELVRRLNAARCFFVTYPEGCKDLSDVRMKLGPEAVAAVINGAKPFPVRGLYRLSDYPDLPTIETFSTGWSTINDRIRVFPGELLVVTGVPGHGKSQWVFNLLVNLGRLHSWVSAIFGPEMPTVPHTRGILRKIVHGREPTTIDDIRRTDAFLERHFLFIDADPTGQADTDFTLEWIIERAADAVLRDGIRVLVIDPWNEVEHAKLKGESSSDYIGRSLRALRRFARLWGVMVIIVAHPTKDIADRGKVRTPGLYDIDGAAHWFNKCDHGVVVERPESNEGEAWIWIPKVKFEGTGERGRVSMRFDKTSGRFLLLDGRDEMTEVLL